MAVNLAEFMAEVQTEHQFMRTVIAVATAYGWLVYHTHISKRSAEGFPDLCLVRRGRLVFAELKREKGGRVSPAQQEWLDQLAVAGRDAGGAVRVFLWKPSHWPQIEEVLR